jgi:BirA family biotin operon repressor/biotin-[acetyl-CoA-carboxylase] ligase
MAKSEYELIRLKSCPSTNDYIKLALPEGIDSKLPVFVLANQQTGGRGRLGRTWSSPPGGIYLSLLWPEAMSAGDAQSLPPIVALAVRAALQPLTTQQLALKWPNDLLVVSGSERHKLAGILVELFGDRVIIGIGVNVYPAAHPSPCHQLSQSNLADQGDLPQEKLADFGGLSQAWLADTQLDDTAAKNLLNKAVEALIETLLQYLSNWQANEHSFANYAQEYRQYLIQVNEYVEVRNANGELLATGIVQGIDDSACLLIRSGNSVQKVSSGEITLRTE